jgi:hypothetical protein
MSSRAATAKASADAADSSRLTRSRSRRARSRRRAARARRVRRAASRSRAMAASRSTAYRPTATAGASGTVETAFGRRFPAITMNRKGMVANCLIGLPTEAPKPRQRGFFPPEPPCVDEPEASVSWSDADYDQRLHLRRLRVSHSPTRSTGREVPEGRESAHGSRMQITIPSTVPAVIRIAKKSVPRRGMGSYGHDF